jgi:hypothetical protein
MSNLLAHNYFTPVRQGAKWLQSEILGLNSLGFTGNVFYVKPSTGSNSQSGETPEEAFKTLAYALSKCTAGNNDVVYLVSESNTASATTDYQSVTLDWNKDLTHLVGVCAPTQVSQRARIAALSTATGVSPVLKVSANDCYISNIQVFGGITGDATSLGAVQVTGTRNVFDNVNIAGMGTTSSVTTGGYSLRLTGAQENVFQNCVIGLDTITRDNTTQGEVWFDSGAVRNDFLYCSFPAFISNAGYTHVTFTGTTSIDRYTDFVGCVFYSGSTNDATTQTQIFGSMDGFTQGYINLKDCAAYTPGATTAVWIDTGTNRLKVANGGTVVKTGGEAVIVN